VFHLTGTLRHMVSRVELEGALEHYQATVRRASTSGDWTLFASLFTANAKYNEHAYGRFEGRDRIAAWAVRTMTSFPGNCMVEFPVAWAVYDADRGWIVCEIRNLMRDPGDGSVHETPNTTILHYADENLFSYEEDVYNPMNFAAMVAGWARVADAHDRLPDEGRIWLDRFAPGWNAVRT
jgi:SnoaL-like domain